MRVGKKIGYFILTLFMAASTAHADYTPKLPIVLVDAAQAGATYITLEGYSNDACDNHRLLINATNADHYKQLVAMALSAMYAGAPVSFAFDVNANQCVVTRLFSYRN